MLCRYLLAEALKLRRSLVLLLCLAAPSCVVGLNTLISLRTERPTVLAQYAMATPALWAYAMLPLTVTALSVLLAQMEHGPRTWLHLLTLPGARPNLYLAKALVMLLLVAGMSVLLWVEILLGGALVTALRDDAIGAIDAGTLGVLLMRMALASMLVAMLQLWVALRFRSFVPPLVFGITGTFAAITATGAKEGVYFPWLMAVNMLNAASDRLLTALLLGSLGGVAVMLVMLADLSRREA